MMHHRFYTNIKNIYKEFRKLWDDEWVRRSSIWILVSILFSLGVILWKWQSLPPVVPFWYSRAWGADQLAPTVFLFIFPISTFFWYFFTTGVALIIAKQYQVFLHVLYLTSLVTALLTNVSLIMILRVIS